MCSTWHFILHTAQRKYVIEIFSSSVCVVFQTSNDSHRWNSCYLWKVADIYFLLTGIQVSGIFRKGITKNVPTNGSFVLICTSRCTELHRKLVFVRFTITKTSIGNNWKEQRFGKRSNKKSLHLLSLSLIWLFELPPKMTITFIGYRFPFAWKWKQTQVPDA